MADLHSWWKEREGESFWLEVTDREDLGVNLKAPQQNEAGGDFWSYSLVREVVAGDVVFHYDRPSQRIMARSEATGDVWDDQLVWGARGTYARQAGVEPYPRPGWYAGLTGFGHLEMPLELEGIRSKMPEIRPAYKHLVKQVGSPLYFPFETGVKRPTRPMQGYLFKLPRFFVELFPELSAGLAFGEVAMGENEEGLGAGYRRADEETSVGSFDPMEVDPAVVERGTRGHAITQNALADYVHSIGLVPRSPKPDEPNFDLAWDTGAHVFVAEVKSVTNRNEERQLRMGLGQVLQYRYSLERQLGRPVVAVLAAERRPPNAWVELLESLAVRVVWPGDFSRLS